MRIAEFLKPECVSEGISASNKRRVLHLLADLLAKGDSQLSVNAVLQGLLERESLGGTSLGRGVAIPHSRTKDANKVVGAFLKLEQGLDFGACDHVPVDIFFALAVPETTNEHLQVLAQLARVFHDPEFCKQLRSVKDRQTLYQLITEK
ncbi:nitrogen PTS system EIIA component [Gammaproteobacteria bacterium]